MNQIIKKGTKEAVKYLSASEAHKILASSGLTRNGNEYEWYDEGLKSTAISVEVGKDHVTSVYWNGLVYCRTEGTLDEYIAGFG